MLKIITILLCAVVAVEPVVFGMQVGQMVGEKVRGSVEFKYIVSIRNLGKVKYKCGGALIRLDVVLTAGHCVFQADKNDLIVRAGIVNQILEQESGEKRNVKSVFIHKSFKTNPLMNDIALLFLYKAFPKSRFIGPIALPTSSEYKMGTKGTIAGWGLTEYGLPSDWLIKTDLMIISNEVCQRFIDSRKIPPTAICGIDQKGGAACDGDSGGPFEYNDEVIGISSFTMGRITLSNNKETCDPKLPSVFTRVAKFLTWIKSCLKKNPIRE